MARALAMRAVAGSNVASPTSIRRILIAHNLLLGDTILLAPLLKKLATIYPDAERVVLARPAVAPLFAKRPYGVTVMPYNRRDAESQARVMHSGPWDLAIVPDDNRYAWLARAARARRVIGFAHDRPAWKNWMLDTAIAYPDVPAAWADMTAGLELGHAAGHAAGSAPEPFRPGEWPAPDARAFELPERPYAVLHVGASTPLKLWPADRWRALADHLSRDGFAIAWSGGAGEAKVLDAIGKRDNEVDLIGRLDLPQLWQLLANAALLVCPDTGVAHLSRIVGVPTIALFGPGSAVIHGAGAFWADAPFTAVTIADFPCRDQRVLYRREIDWVRRCGRAFEAGAEPGGRTCGDARCMKAIALEDVLGAFRALRPAARARA